MSKFRTLIVVVFVASALSVAARADLILEGDPGWDCSTMGNGECGGNTTVTLGVEACAEDSIPPLTFCGPNTRSSTSTLGLDGDANSGLASISADGRYVAFESDASNLVIGDTNEVQDVFVHDREEGSTTRVSVSSNGEQANRVSSDPVISADGRYVAFTSLAILVPEDTSVFVQDVYVHDRRTSETSRVSLGLEGAEANGGSFAPAISADGRFVAFGSSASNLVVGDTNSTLDVFVFDRTTGETSRVSVASDGTEAIWPTGSNFFMGFPSISADGRYVAFESGASNLVPGDTNERYDVFLHDRLTPETTRVSVGPSGLQADQNPYPGLEIPAPGSTVPSISADGRVVAFLSRATNLVSGDTNSAPDVFVHEADNGTTSRVSVATGGAQAFAGVDAVPSISADGRYVAFHSLSSALVSGDTNQRRDVFVHDRVRKTTDRVSLDQNGEQADEESVYPSISADGRYVAFQSLAALVLGDVNNLYDVYVRDRGRIQPTVSFEVDVQVTPRGKRPAVDARGVAGSR